MSDRPERDLVVESALASLEAPPARARFHERLWERVDGAEHADAVETPALLKSLAAPPARARFRERLWDRIDTAEQVEASEARPVDRTGAGRSRHWLFRRPRLAAAAMVAAAVAAWAAVSLVGLPGSREGNGILSGPPPAVAQVIESVRLRLDSCRSIAAIFTYQRAGEPAFRARVVATSDGRVRTMAMEQRDGSWRVPPADATLADTPGLHLQVTSMPDGTRTEAWNSGKGLRVRHATDLAPGPPDAAGIGLFPVEYAGQMSALAIAGSKVTSATYEGRPVLVVSAPAGPASPVSSTGSASSAPVDTSASAPRFDAVSMTIDRSTWLPIRVARTYKGRVVEVWGFKDVQLDPPLTTADFAVQLPSGAELATGTDQGFRRLSLPKASAAVRGRLFVPATLPEGFTLSLAAARTPEPTLEKPLAASDSTVVSLVYRRGFRSVVVTTRSARGDALGRADDPFVGASTTGVSGTQQVVLRSGGLAGAEARLSSRPLELPHLWALQGGLLVTVAGDVTPKELRQIAGSLETYGVWRTRQVFTAYAAATRAYDLNTLSDLYSRGVEIDSRTYPAEDVDDALIKNAEMTDYFVSGKTVAPFVGDGTVLWEAWPGTYSPWGGSYNPEAVAELVTVRGDKIVREDFSWVTGPSVKAGEASPHPARLQSPLGSADTAAAAHRIAARYVAALTARDAAKLARMSAGNVAFLDVGYGDAGGRSALLRRYERMFRFPADLTFSGMRVFSGPGWVVVGWTASSEAFGYDKAPGLTVLEIRNGRITRETLYCARGEMPFR
jgi:uncharacterized membrane protein